MSSTPKSLAKAGIVLTAMVSFALCGQARAQDTTSQARSPRGGILASAEGHQFEVFFYPTGVRVFLLDASGHLVDASRLTGHATFYHPNAPNSPWFSRPLHLDLMGPDHLPASLDLNIGLASAPRTGATVDFEIMGLESKTSSTAEFKVPLEFVRSTATRLVAGSEERIPLERPSVPVNTGLAQAIPSITPLTYAPGGVLRRCRRGQPRRELHRDACRLVDRSDQLSAFEALAATEGGLSQGNLEELQPAKPRPDDRSRGFFPFPPGIRESSDAPGRGLGDGRRVTMSGSNPPPGIHRGIDPHRPSDKLDDHPHALTSVRVNSRGAAEFSGRIDR